MPSNKNNAYGSRSARDAALERVDRDIRQRDMNDIYNAYDKKGTFILPSGTRVPMNPEKYTGKLTKLEKMAAMDAVERDNRRGITYGESDRNTGRGISRSESDAQRKRLIDRYSQGYKKGGLVKKPAAKAAPKPAPKAAPKRLVMKKKGK